MYKEDIKTCLWMALFGVIFAVTNFSTTYLLSGATRRIEIYSCNDLATNGSKECEFIGAAKQVEEG